MITQLKYVKRESKLLISKIYSKKNLPFLKRKYDKVKIALAKDLEAIISAGAVIGSQASLRC